MVEKRRRVKKDLSAIAEDGKTPSGVRAARKPRSKRAVKVTDSVKERIEAGEVIIPEAVTDEEGLVSTMLPVTVPDGSKMKPKTLLKLRSEARERDIVLLVSRGYDFQTIARKLKYSSSTRAYEAWQRAMTKVITPHVEEQKKLELQRLDNMLVALEARIEHGDLGAIDRAIKVQERRSKLIGLDAATKFEGSVDHHVSGGIIIASGSTQDYVVALAESAGMSVEEIQEIMAESRGDKVPALTDAQREAHLALNEPIADDQITDAELIDEDE